MCMYPDREHMRLYNTYVSNDNTGLRQVVTAERVRLITERVRLTIVSESYSIYEYTAMCDWSLL